MIGALVAKVKPGDRVSYEDMANPLHEGVVTEVIDSEWGRSYRVFFAAVESKFGPEYGLAARETVTDLRQPGWKWLGETSVPADRHNDDPEPDRARLIEEAE